MKIGILLKLLFMFLFLGNCKTEPKLNIQIEGYCQFVRVELITDHKIVHSNKELTSVEKDTLVDMLGDQFIPYLTDHQGNIWLSDYYCSGEQFLALSFELDRRVNMQK